MPVGLPREFRVSHKNRLERGKLSDSDSRDTLSGFALFETPVQSVSQSVSQSVPPSHSAVRA